MYTRRDQEVGLRFGYTLVVGWFVVVNLGLCACQFCSRKVSSPSLGVQPLAVWGLSGPCVPWRIAHTNRPQAIEQRRVMLQRKCITYRRRLRTVHHPFAVDMANCGRGDETLYRL